MTTSAKAASIYEIDIVIDASPQAIWHAITDFKAYPTWNSVLRMTGNDQLVIGQNFDVTIIKANQKTSNFKAETLSKVMHQNFVAQQIMVGPWFFSATHHFIIEPLNKKQTRFVQKWELKGLVAKCFKSSIFKALDQFKQMNTDLKNHLEDK